MTCMIYFSTLCLGIFTLRGRDEDLQGSLRYEVLGISPAPLYFRVHPGAGTVFTRDDLRKDRALSYTVSNRL